MAARRVALALACVVTIVCALPAAAQSTRVEAIEREQAAKAKDTGKEGPSEAELVVRRILASPLLSGGDGAYPWFGSVYGGTGMGLGAGYTKHLENAASLNVQTGISLNNSLLVRGSVAAPEFWRGTLQVDASAQYLDARGVSYYGGQDSDRQDRERFDYSPFELTGNATVKPAQRLALTGTYSFLGFDTQRDVPRLTEQDAPGLDRSLSYHVARGTAMFDWRPSKGYSTRGGFLRASAERNIETQAKPYSYSLQEFEAVQLVPLVREQFVLAGRALMTLTQPDHGDTVPVVLLPYLGSGSAFRGHANRRFADRNRLLLSGEYRWRPSRYLDMALFVDAGQVAPDPADFEAGRFETAWGLGARLHGPTFNAVRIEVARGREGIRVIVSGSQPF
ncbi:MAG: hypothetical protein RLZZ53_1557 [Acidobacteriota bacterium]|jgi:hypothetical protein